jgi:hypothetical protein
MTTLIPFRSSSLPPGELAAVLSGASAALPEAQLVESKGATLTDPATLALFVGAAATTVAGIVGAIATVWAARIAARKPEAPAAAPQVFVIVVETNHTTVRVVVDPANPAAAVAGDGAAALPASPAEVTGVRLETTG